MRMGVDNYEDLFCLFLECDAVVWVCLSEVLKDCNASRLMESKKYRLDLENEGTVIVRNVGACEPKDSRFLRNDV